MSEQRTSPHAYQVMQEVLGFAEASELAHCLNISVEAVRSWTREPECAGGAGTGRRGPLGQLELVCMHLMEFKGQRAAEPIAAFVARTCGGAFVPLPRAAPKADSEAVEHMSAALKEAGEFVEKLRSSWFDTSPGRIDAWFELPALLVEGEEAVVAILAGLEFAKRKAGS